MFTHSTTHLSFLTEIISVIHISSLYQIVVDPPVGADAEFSDSDEVQYSSSEVHLSRQGDFQA